MYLLPVDVAVSIERSVLTNVNEKVIITPAVVEIRNVLIRRVNPWAGGQGPLDLHRLRVHRDHLPVQCDQKRSIVPAASDLQKSRKSRTNRNEENEEVRVSRYSAGGRSELKSWRAAPPEAGVAREVSPETK